ncbi:MAG: 30S ribosomal protein S17e [Candidatus Hydrothermarchaeales archaeon]
MGRVRPQIVKRTALEAVKTHGDRFTTDFKENKRILSEALDLESKVMKNRIAGYITSLRKKG